MGLKVVSIVLTLLKVVCAVETTDLVDTVSVVADTIILSDSTISDSAPSTSDTSQAQIEEPQKAKLKTVFPSKKHEKKDKKPVIIKQKFVYRKQVGTALGMMFFLTIILSLGTSLNPK